MGFVWVTNASTAPGPVVNSLNAACDAGHFPDSVYLLSNPKVDHVIDPIRDRARSIVEAYTDHSVTVETTDLAEETNFSGIVDHYRDAINAAKSEGDTVAVDVTPGRKFMSAIAFQAGFQFDADHVFYLHVESNRFYNQAYPEIPRSGIDLIDFTEALP